MRNHRNRTPTKPGRVLFTPEDGSLGFYGTITRADEPTDVGCPIDKITLDELLAASGVTSGSDTTLILEQDGFQLVDGATVRFRLHINTGAMATLNISGTGAKYIKQQNHKYMKGGIPAGTWLTVIYSGVHENFILQGSGGDELIRYGNGAGQISTFELMLFGGFDPNYARNF